MAGINDSDKKNLFGWGQKKFTKEQIEELLERVKQFNAGCIDEYLSNHVDKVYDEWLKSQ